MKRLLLPVLLTVFYTASAIAQSSSEPILDSINDQIFRYADGQQSPEVFLHLDKTIYVRNENIWLTAYWLNPNNTSRLHSLHVVLTEEATQKQISTDRFVMDSGIAKGAVFLGDSLEPGEYRLVAYTNIFPGNIRNPVFQQQITIKTADVPPFSLQYMPPLKNSATQNDTVPFIYKVQTSRDGIANYGIAAGGSLQYTLFAGDKKISSGKQKINDYGEVNLWVLRSQTLGKKISITATIDYQKQKATIKTRIPLFTKTVGISFYPEGGNLVNGQDAQMALEIKTALGLPVVTTGELEEDGSTVAAFETDVYGNALLDFTPVIGRKYTVKLADASVQLIYTFPDILSRGYALHVPHALVKGDDILVEISSPQKKGVCYAMVHNYREAFYSCKLQMGKSRGRLKIPTAGMPDGVATITLFDENGVPQAERAICLQRQKPLQVSITTDSAVYHLRSKVQMTVQIKDATGNPVQAGFSLACVLNNRVDTARFTDIVRYNYYDRFLPATNPLPPLSYFVNEASIDRILLTKFWTRYKWNEMKQAQPLEGDGDLPFLSGQVYHRGRKVKKPVNMLLVSDSLHILFETDSSGRFELPSNAFRLPTGKKGYVVVASPDKFDDYRLEMHSTLTRLEDSLAHIDYPDAVVEKAELVEEEKKHLKATLQTVVVKAEKDNRYSPGFFRSSDCNDWVCMYNILNCPNHRFGSQPVNGEVYTLPGRGRVVYVACVQDSMKPSPFMQFVRGTYYAKEFYVSDYSKFNPPEPEMMSTMFWAHQVTTDANGEAKIWFYTNDLNGRYWCILQGLSGAGAVSGRYSFRLVK